MFNSTAVGMFVADVYADLLRKPVKLFYFWASGKFGGFFSAMLLERYTSFVCSTVYFGQSDSNAIKVVKSGYFFLFEINTFIQQQSKLTVKIL